MVFGSGKSADALCRSPLCFCLVRGLGGVGPEAVQGEQIDKRESEEEGRAERGAVASCGGPQARPCGQISVGQFGGCIVQAIAEKASGALA
jgi:hypothetical protein